VRARHRSIIHAPQRPQHDERRKHDRRPQLVVLVADIRQRIQHDTVGVGTRLRALQVPARPVQRQQHRQHHERQRRKQLHPQQIRPDDHQAIDPRREEQPRVVRGKDRVQKREAAIDERPVQERPRPPDQIADLRGSLVVDGSPRRVVAKDGEEEEDGQAAGRGEPDGGDELGRIDDIVAIERGCAVGRGGC